MNRKKHTVEAQEFILKDAGGRVRATLTAAGEGAQLLMLDGNGKPRLVLFTGPDLSGLTLYDGHGQRLIRVDAEDSGVGMVLEGRPEKAQVWLDVGADGPRFLLVSNKGKLVYRAPKTTSMKRGEQWPP